MDITPIIPKYKKIIQAYSSEGFKINDERFNSNLIVIHNEIITWNVIDFESINLSDFDIIKQKEIEILLIGSGATHKSLSAKIKYGLDNISVEVMNTGAACRTYNILLGEGRFVAAALIKT